MEKTQKDQKKSKKTLKKRKNNENSVNKDKYFSFYDDIKHGSHKVVDW